MLGTVVLSTMVTKINLFIVSSHTGLRHMNNIYRKLLLKKCHYLKPHSTLEDKAQQNSVEHKKGQS